MSYKLSKTTSDKERADFIVQYNHNQGLLIKEGTDTYTAFKDEQELTFEGEFIFALEVNEIIGEVEAEIDVPDFEIVEEEVVNPETGEIEIIQKEVPVMVDKEIDVPDFDDDGNIIGYHTEVVKVQSYHKETVILHKPIINPNWDEEQYIKREQEFNKSFFNTSLGYVRRSVTMADGSHKDFLSDLLPVISMGIQGGMPVNILTYDKPPFDEDVEDWEQYQHLVAVTQQFIQECFLQLSADFAPINNEEE